MKRVRKFLSVIFLLFFSCSAFCQHINSDGFSITLKKFVQGQSSVVCGKQRPAYGGIFKVTSKNQCKGIYYFTLIYLDDKQAVFTIKNKDNVLVNPMLVLNAPSKSFQYIKNDIIVEEIFIDDNKPIQEQILSGMLLWLKVKCKS